MFNLTASVFGAIGAFFGGLFGGHLGWGVHASSTPPVDHMPPGFWQSATTSEEHRMMPAIGNGIFGIVTAVNGTTITVDGRQGTSTATTTYSVDASNAKIIKGAANGTTTAAVSDIQVNDRVIVQGTVNTDDSVTATTIIDGIGLWGPRPFDRGAASSTATWQDRQWNGSTTPPIMRREDNSTSSRPEYGQGDRPLPPGVNPGGPMMPAGGDGPGGQ